MSLKIFTRTSAIPRTRHSRPVTHIPASILIQLRSPKTAKPSTLNTQEDATCVAFQAKIFDPVEDDSPDIVVKFVTRYGRDVHKFLASENHAPRLRYCGPLSGTDEEQSPATLSSQQSPVLSLGPMQMVVMDYVSHRGPIRRRSTN
jgi:hypothetical protein